jgi:hypothetical protein
MRKSIILSTIIAIFLVCTSQATGFYETGSNLYTNMSKMYFSKIIQANDGGYIAIGGSNKFQDEPNLEYKGQYDGIIAKYSPGLSLLWVKRLGGTGTELFTSVVESSDGNILVAGSTTSIDGDFQVTREYGGQDAFLICLDNLGKIKWRKKYGGEKTDVITNLISFNNNEIVAQLVSSSNDGSLIDIENINNQNRSYLVKLDYSGKMNSIKRMVDANNKNYFCSEMSIKLTGGASGYCTIDDLPRVLHFDSQYNISSYYSISGTAYTLTPDGGYITVGNIDVPTEYDERIVSQFGVIRKYSKDGVLEWEHKLGGYAQSYTQFLKVTLSSDNEIVVQGVTNANDGDFEDVASLKQSIVLLAYDISGQLIDKKLYGYGSDDYPSNGFFDKNGDYVFCGAFSLGTLGFIQKIPLGSFQITNINAANSISKGQTKNLTTNLNFGSNNLIWTSSNPKVVSVNSVGKITAVNAGIAIISVKKTLGSNSRSIKVTVTGPVTSISVKQTTYAMKVGNSITISPSISPSTAVNKTVYWASGNPKVAKVDSKGRVTAVSPGSTVITLKTVDGGKTAKITINVKK